MGTDKRERKKANRQAKLQAEQAAAARQRRVRTIRNAVVAGVAIVAVMVLISMLSGCSSNEEATPTDGATDPYGDATCPPADGATQRRIEFDDAPRRCIDPERAYTATIETSEGTVEVALDTSRTPLTANNFVALARWGYYDGTDLFRTEADTGIIQGGGAVTQDASDPGPGYTIPDESIPFGVNDYGPGTLAMARTSAPDSAGSQFFFLANEGGSYLGDQAQLGPSAGTYVVFGRVTEGLEVLRAIAESDDGTGSPSSTVSIDDVTITET